MEEKFITKTTVNGETYKLKDEDAARSGELSEEIVNREAADSQLGAELGQKQDTLTETQLAAVNSGIDAAKVAQISTNTASISDLDAELDGVTEKIPEQASAENQLADKSFVNSSVQTATANFRGNWANFAAVPTDANLYPVDYAGQKTPTTNDYLVVQDASDFPVAQGEPALEGTWRFKYSGDWATTGKNGWHPEYQVNETPLTSDQLAALNSGITQQAVEKLADIPADAEANTIDSISVNGVAQTPDANKNVDLTIPAGIIETLTVEDYDYHDGGSTDDGIALWRLEPGFYLISPNTAVYGRSNRADGFSVDTGIRFAIITNAYRSNWSAELVDVTVIGRDFYGNSFAGDSNISTYERVLVSSGVPQSGASSGSPSLNRVITRASIIDNLSSYNGRAPLSAYQGRVLADRIGNLSTLTTTAKTSTVAAINEIVTSIGNVESALNAINNGGNA